MAKLNDFQAANDLGKNRLLAHWLSSDADRRALYAELAQNPAFGGVLPFPSATSPNASAYLIADPSLIRLVLANTTDFTNTPYAALGSGNFVLGQGGPDHRRQREFIKRLLDTADPLVEAAAAAAWREASVRPLKQHEFDLVELAHDAAVRFACRLFGYHARDVALVSVIMNGLSERLNRQIIGRHFESPPETDGAFYKHAAQAKDAWRKLSVRTDDLIAAYRKDPQQARDPEADDLPADPPLLQTLATQSGAPVGVQLRTIAIGCIAGLVGNVEAAVSIAVQDFFAKPETFVQARQAAQQPDLAPLGRMIDTALLRHPPAAFLPRTAQNLFSHGALTIAGGTEMILAMGAATGCPAAAAHTGDEPLVYGRITGGHSAVLHHCPGERIGQQVIRSFVASVLRIDGLAQTFDERGEVRPLEKRWGLRCLSYPLSHERARRLVQQPLTVVMRVKNPSENAPKLQRVIAAAAPLIEQRLRESGHVHFAWFALLDGDRQLALFTTYDGDFDTYIEYFALRVGDLFDRIFEWIEDPPPLPVRQYPKDFVAKIRAYDQPQVAGYFFSAYPDKTASHIRPVEAHRSAASPLVHAPVPPSAPTPKADPAQHWHGTQLLITKNYELKCSRHVVLAVRDDAAKARGFLAKVAGQVTAWSTGSMPDCALNIGFTHAGLSRLELPDRYLRAFAAHAPAFTQGAYARAALHLADTAASAAEHWEAYYHPIHAHMLLTLHAADEATLEKKQKELEAMDVERAWTCWEWKEQGAHLTETKPRKVHFGYTDGWSVVHIRGIHGDGTHEPGEFLLGHPNNAGVDPWAKTLDKDGMRDFFTNGSFGAFRKIEQDEHEFRAYVGATARAMNVSGEYLMAKMCGRWPDGRIVCPQDGDRAPAAHSPDAKTILDTAHVFDQDRAGHGCPFGSHMRRMNPRGDPVVPARQRPLIRRGMPYGREFGTPGAEQDARGLLGLFFCASLEDQFEHLLSSWGSRNPMGPPNLGDSSDPLIGGHHRPDEKFAIPMADGSHRWLSGFAPFVTTRGTLYLFYPTVAALGIIAAAGQAGTT